MGDDADAIWGHCRGYPGHADGPGFAAFMRGHTLEAALFFAAYGGQTVEQVHTTSTGGAADRVRDRGPEARRRRPEDPLRGDVPAAMTELDRNNIQGFVVRGYRLPFAALRVPADRRRRARARAALADFIPQVITAEHWTDKPTSGINVAFSFEGLRALGLAEALARRLPGGVPRRHGGARGRARRLRRQRARALGGPLPRRRTAT